MKSFESKINQFELIQTDQWPTYDLKITLKPSFKCNHKCWFCSEYDNSTSMWSEQDVALVIEKLSTIPVDRKKLFFYFYGGEPTLSPHWQYLNQQLLKIFSDRQVFIQTQTNMSLSTYKLDSFLADINTYKSDNHTIDICSSYHIGKQTADEFIEKMKICDKHECLGLCFFSTEIPKHDQCVEEFNQLAREFPEKIKLRFTETHNLKNKKISGYEQHLHDEFLVGDDNGKSLEFRYWLRKYPEWRKFFEPGWNFDVDGDVYNFSEVSGNNIHKRFKHMKCECGTKNMVIDHNLNVYHCNDDFYKGINISRLENIDIEQYLSRDVRCLNTACYDGLDFRKYR